MCVPAPAPTGSTRLQHEPRSGHAGLQFTQRAPHVSGQKPGAGGREKASVLSLATFLGELQRPDLAASCLAGWWSLR